MKPTYQTVGGNRLHHTAFVARASRLARGALLFVGIGLGRGVGAQEPVTEPVPVADEAAPEPADAAELLDLARLRLDQGDEDGARIVILQALERPEVDADAATYLLGLAWELGGDPAQGLALYDEGLARWPTSALSPDRAYRRAEAFAALGRPAEALTALEVLGRYPLDARDQRKVALSRATWTVAAGRTGPGLRLLRDALADLPASDLPWQQARARATLAGWLADEAAELHLDVPEKKVVKRLEERLALIRRVEKEATAIAALDQPEWVLDAVLTLGAAYEALADDLAAHRRPRRLTPDQLALYEPAVAEKIDAARVKALRAYDLGLDMAVRIGWTGPGVEPLRAARDALSARIRP